MSALVHFIVPFLPLAPANAPVPPVTVTLPAHVSFEKLLDGSAPNPSVGVRSNVPWTEPPAKYCQYLPTVSPLSGTLKLSCSTPDPS